jgi:glucose-1-phosphatase
VTVVLFDLGNVLVEVTGYRVIANWLGESDLDAVVAHWLESPIVQRFERGQCSVDAFASAIIKDYEIDMTPGDFITAFKAWPQGLSTGAAQLVREARRSNTVACFSNTNVIHWNSQTDHEQIKNMFDATFASHEIGFVKPERAAFEYVVEHLGVRPEEIVFLDDAEPNTVAARDIGIQGHRVLGVEEARAVLSNLNLLPTS